MAIDPDIRRLGADLWRDNRGDVAAVAFVVGFVVSLLLGWSVTPFHYYDCLAVLAVSFAPVLLAAALLFGLGDRLAGGMAGAAPGGALNAVAGLALVAVVCPGNLALWINQRFDGSPAVAETVPVVEAWTRHGRGHTNWLVGVTTAVASPTGARSLYGAQPVTLTRSQWERVEPGRTRLVLREHRGALRFPWFEPEPALAD